jgi:catechol 2,3-dioxygenase-like lactoylglutathione lyase family enzyme
VAHSLQVVIACDDPNRLAEFWAAALGYIMQPPPEGHESWEAFADEMGIPEERRNDIRAVVDPDDVGPRILFERWDVGQPSRRVHLDINSVGGAMVELSDEERRARLAEERDRLEVLGATYGREATGMAGEIWIEMYDPEGNWFCVQ